MSVYYETPAKGRIKREDGTWANKADGIDDDGVQAVRHATKDVTFHNAATVAADGATFAVEGYKTLTVEIYGTSVSRTVAFMGVGASGTARAIKGVNLTDLSLATSTAGTAELWQFDITGLKSVIMDLTSISGGNVSVKGTAVG